MATKMDNDPKVGAGWWIRCAFSGFGGNTWEGYLLKQGSKPEDGEWVVISGRNEAARELSKQGEFLWITRGRGEEDRLVHVSRLEFAELDEVA